jgi:hypothetical protein
MAIKSVNYTIQNQSGVVPVLGKQTSFNATSSEINVNFSLNINAVINRSTKEITIRNSSELTDVTGLDDIKAAINTVLTDLDSQIS